MEGWRHDPPGALDQEVHLTPVEATLSLGY